MLVLVVVITGRVIPVAIGFRSFQFLHTSSHVISLRILYNVGSLGFLLARRKP